MFTITNVGRLATLMPLLLIKTLAYSRSYFQAEDNGSDLDVFVTRPDLRPPKFQIQVHEPDLVSPGYWFVAAYSSLETTYKENLYVPAQTGAFIYDGNGDLVWSGAHLFEIGRPVFDFKMIDVDGSQHLSLLALPNKRSYYHPEGVGLILDSTFTIQHEVKSRVGSGIENMHEFNVIEDGKRALMLTYQAHAASVDFPRASNPAFLSVGNCGFAEIEVATGKIIYEWWSLDRIHINETSVRAPNGGQVGIPWDWLHLNSVDKNSQGDYLISARFTNTIYKISGLDGSILWRFGGKFSSFTLEGFNFSAQHDARFRDQDFILDRDQSTTYISFMDNGVGSGYTTSNYSMGLIVALDTATMTARLVSKYARPDNRQTLARGNFQILPNSNVVAAWSENAYCSEFTADGLRVLDTNFTTGRFATYRAYKFNLTSDPAESPILKAFIYGESPSTSTCAFYMSWNGATKVASWRLFAKNNITDEFSLIGTVSKTNFESSYMIFGYYEYAYAQAIASDGDTILRQTSVESIRLPAGWHRGDDNHNAESKSISSASSTEQLQEHKEIHSGMFQNLLPQRTTWKGIGNLRYRNLESSYQTLVAAACVFLTLAALILITCSRSGRSWSRHFRKRPSRYIRSYSENGEYQDDMLDTSWCSSGADCEVTSSIKLTNGK